MEGGKIDGNLGIFLSWAVEGFVLFLSLIHICQKADKFLARTLRDDIVALIFFADGQQRLHKIRRDTVAITKLSAVYFYNGCAVIYDA